MCRQRTRCDCRSPWETGEVSGYRFVEVESSVLEHTQRRRCGHSLDTEAEPKRILLSTGIRRSTSR